MVKMGDIWDRTVEFLSDQLGALLPIALAAFLVPSAIMSNLWDLIPGGTLGFRGAAACAVLVLSIVMFWGQLAVTALAIDSAPGHLATRTATRRLPAALLVAVIVAVVSLLLILPFPVILVASGMRLAGGAVQAADLAAVPAGARLAASLYLLAALIFGLWLYARLILVTPIVVGEGHALGAFGRSFARTRGMALKIIGVLFLYVITSWVAESAGTFVFGAIFRLVAGSGDGGVSLASVLTTILVSAIQTGFTVLGTAFVAKLYLALSVSPAIADA